MQLVPGSERIVAAASASPVAGAVRWAPGKSLWLAAMTGAATALCPVFASWDAILLFAATSAVTLCFGHSVGMHRRLIHNSFACPRWLEYGCVYLGTLVGMAGPIGEWEPERKLAFVVVDDVPAMRELSPYRHVHAPHVIGYFRTTYTSFELLPRPSGGTRIVERTTHQLRLDPAPYWLPIARWVVHQNNMGVLAHLRRQAEQAARPGG
jgi:hypothetical protein